jgi:hypothetical protein
MNWREVFEVGKCHVNSLVIACNILSGQQHTGLCLLHIGHLIIHTIQHL